MLLPFSYPLPYVPPSGFYFFSCWHFHLFFLLHLCPDGNLHLDAGNQCAHKLYFVAPFLLSIVSCGYSWIHVFSIVSCGYSGIHVFSIVSCGYSGIHVFSIVSCGYSGFHVFSIVSCGYSGFHVFSIVSCRCSGIEVLKITAQQGSIRPFICPQRGRVPFPWALYSVRVIRTLFVCPSYSVRVIRTMFV